MLWYKIQKIRKYIVLYKTPNQNNLVFLYQLEPFVLVHFFRKSVKILSRGKRTVQKGKVDGLSESERPKVLKWTVQVVKVDDSSHESGRSKG